MRPIVLPKEHPSSGPSYAKILVASRDASTLGEIVSAFLATIFVSLCIPSTVGGAETNVPHL